jgi:hypothetical protein
MGGIEESSQYIFAYQLSGTGVLGKEVLRVFLLVNGWWFSDNYQYTYYKK